MKIKIIITAMVVALMLVSFAGRGLTAETTIEGQLIKIVDGEFYVIKDENGDEHRLHFDETTKTTGDVKAGAKVEVMVDDREHVVSITVLEATQKNRSNLND